MADFGKIKNNQNRAIFENRGGKPYVIWLPVPAFSGTVPIFNPKCFEQLKRNPGKMYGVMAGQLLKNICHQSDKTEIIFSRKDSKLKLRQELEIEVERVRLGYLQNHQNLKAQFIISYQHSPHYTHSGLQIADYIAYAVFQVYENRNIKWYEMVKNKIGKIQDICNKKYFTRSNPLQLST